MLKQNCWQFKKCGREKGGSKVSELGVCSAASENRTNGVNGGRNGGRACWVIAGTLCEGKVECSYVLKMGTCKNCDFRKLVEREEGQSIEKPHDILARLR